MKWEKFSELNTHLEDLDEDCRLGLLLSWPESCFQCIQTIRLQVHQRLKTLQTLITSALTWSLSQGVLITSLVTWRHCYETTGVSMSQHNLLSLSHITFKTYFPVSGILSQDDDQLILVKKAGGKLVNIWLRSDQEYLFHQFIFSWRQGPWLDISCTHHLSLFFS